MTVPHPRKDLGRGLVKAIFKQAGIEPSWRGVKPQETT